MLFRLCHVVCLRSYLSHLLVLPGFQIRYYKRAPKVSTSMACIWRDLAAVAAEAASVALADGEQKLFSLFKCGWVLIGDIFSYMYSNNILVHYAHETHLIKLIKLILNHVIVM